VRIDINLDEVKEGLEDGWYLVTVTGGEQRTSSNGNEGILWELEIQEPEEFAGWTVGHWTGIEGQSKRFLKRFLKAAQFEWDPTGFHIEDVVGYELEVYIEAGGEDEYDNVIDLREV